MPSVKVFTKIEAGPKNEETRKNKTFFLYSFHSFSFFQKPKFLFFERKTTSPTLCFLFFLVIVFGVGVEIFFANSLVTKIVCCSKVMSMLSLKDTICPTTRISIDFVRIGTMKTCCISTI